MRLNFLEFFSRAAPSLTEQSLRDLREMLETTQAMFAEATDCLLEGRPSKIDLKAEDEGVNEKEERIRRSILTHFSVDPGRDIAFGLTLTAIVQEVERMGDLAKSIEKVSRLERVRPSESRLTPLRNLRDRSLSMAADTIGALDGLDTERARNVMRANDVVKAKTADYLTDLAASDDLGGNEAIVLALSARFVGRFGSHHSNVASGFVLPFDQLRHSLDDAPHQRS